MTYESRLLRIAETLAFDRAHSIDRLKKKKLRKLNEAADIQTLIFECEAAHERLKTYVSIVNRAYQCPVCWVSRGKTAVVSQDGDVRQSFFRCRTCGWEDVHHL